LNLAQPEDSLGFSYNRPLKTWEIQRILQALSLAADESTGSQFARARFKKKLLRDVEKWLKQHGKDGLRFLKPEWRYTLCCGRLYLGDFSDYFGWEYRGWNNPDETAGWATRLYWQDTWKVRPGFTLNYGLAWSFESNALNHDLTKPKLGSLRFMRQAYDDPMNKTDGSWRMIYVGPAGQLIGSLKPQQTFQMPGQPGVPAGANPQQTAGFGPSGS